MSETASLFEKIYRRRRDAGSVLIHEHEMKEILRSRGIPVPSGALCRSADEAAVAARALRFPLVLKLVSGQIMHKTEVGGVAKGIATENELIQTFTAMDASAVKNMIPGYEGILVEEQAPPGVELIIGLQVDDAFGPVLMAGLGGVFTGIFQDVAFRALPVSKNDIMEMLRELKGWPLLDGYRGAAPVSVDSLVDTISALGRLGEELFPLFDSIDFNPVIASSAGCAVVDAKLILPRGDKSSLCTFENPRTENISLFFDPKSVAVIGASTTDGKIGNVILDSLINLEYKGKVFPINPNYDEIMGVKAYPDLSSLPEAPDLVVIVVDLGLIPGIIGMMARTGSRNALIVSGGGKELGGERAALEEEISALAKKHGIRIIGPNCIGSFDGYTRFDSFFYHQDRFRRPGPGPMSFITQSGTWGCAFMESASLTGVSKMVSYGNRADVDEGDLIAFLADDDRTVIIGSYIEGLRDGKKFLHAAAKAVSRKKPVVVFKTGRNPQSALASVSHTGAYGGSYHVYAGVMKQAGIILTDSFHECFGACETLAFQPPAPGKRVALLSNGAGPMVNAIDLFPSKNLELAVLSAGSKKKMRDHFSFFYIVDNPVDVTGSASAGDYEYVITTLLEDENVDVIMPFFVFQNTPLDESIIDRLDILNKKRKKPIICCSAGGPYTAKMASRLRVKGIPVLPDVVQWVTAASSIVRWGEILREKGDGER